MLIIQYVNFDLFMFFVLNCTFKELVIIEQEAKKDDKGEECC